MLGLAATATGTHRFVFAIRVPVVVVLVQAMILLERVVQVAVRPEELRNHTEEPGHLGLRVWLPVVTCTDRVQLLIKITVDDLVSEVVVSLLPEVLGVVRRREVGRHIY